MLVQDENDLTHKNKLTRSPLKMEINVSDNFFKSTEARIGSRTLGRHSNYIGNIFTVQK